MTALDHWIVLPDDDLAYIEDGPESWSDEAMKAWIHDVQEIIAEGLETA